MSKNFKLDRKIGFQNMFYTKCINVIIDSIDPLIILSSIFLILNSWETDLQKSIDLSSESIFRNSNYLYVNFLYYMYTCCYTKNK